MKNRRTALMGAGMMAGVLLGLSLLCGTGRANAEGFTLRVSGGMPDAVIAQAFEAQGIQIDTNTVYCDATDAQRIILAGMETPDVFVMDVDDGYWGLTQKGYLEAIADADIADCVSTYYPAIQEVLTDGERQIVAVPEFITVNHWCANTSLWPQIWGDRPYPSTFLELAQLYAQWNDELAERHPDVKLLEFSGDSQAYLLSVVKQYIAGCEASGAAIDFRQQRFLDTLECIRSLNLKAITLEEEDVYFNQQSLLVMRPFGGFGVEYVNGDRYVPIVPPRIAQDDQPYVPVRMRVMFVNPHSQHKETAYAYMKAVMAGYSAAFTASLVEGWDEPVYSEQGVLDMERIQEEIAFKTEMLGKAQEAGEAEKEDAYTYELLVLRERLDAVAAEAYEVSEEDIVAFHSVAPYMSFLFHSPYASDDDRAMQSISKIIRQFTDGKMTPEQCAEELDAIAQMVEAESP